MGFVKVKLLVFMAGRVGGLPLLGAVVGAPRELMEGRVQTVTSIGAREGVVGGACGKLERLVNEL